uniref:cell division protein FtsL n=1 Tax=Acinetobacter baumannii TaxID=470 RepID=UPI00147AAADE
MKRSYEIETTENEVGKKVVVYSFMVALVFISAKMVVFQAFEYRHDFIELISYMRERYDLNAEGGRLW